MNTRINLIRAKEHIGNSIVNLNLVILYETDEEKKALFTKVKLALLDLQFELHLN